jgi:succinoglycan biosynthesis transport protein ExoP
MEQLTDLASVVRLLKRRLLFFIVPMLLIAVAGSVVVMLLPAMYRSQATILVESQQIPDELVRSTVTALADERLQVIQQRTLSRDNLLALARKFSLLQDRSSLSPTEMADAIRKRIEINQVEASGGRRGGPDRFVLAFTVAYEDESPQRAAGVANELVTTILSADAKARVNQAAETTSFLQEESVRLSQQLTQIEADIAKFRLDNSAALPEKLSFNMSLNERLEKNISDVDREIQGIDEQKRLFTFEASIRTAAGGNVGPDGRSEIDVRIDALRAEIATKSALYSENHPEMKALRRSLKALEAERTDILTQVKSQATEGETATSPSNMEARLVEQKIAALDARVGFLKKQREQFVAASDSLKTIIAKSPDVGSALGTLQRRQETTQKNLDAINNKLAAARLGEKLEEDQRSERFEVIEQPIAPEQPSSPNRKKYLALVLAMALAGGGGIAYGAEMLDRRLRTSADLLSRLNVRPLAVIEYIPLKSEQKRRRIRTIAIVLLILLALAAAIAAVHFYVMPLELIQLKIQQRLNLAL